jgi:hypothetical protein
MGEEGKLKTFIPFAFVPEPSLSLVSPLQKA